MSSRPAAPPSLADLSDAQRAILVERLAARRRAAPLVRRAHEGDAPLSYTQEAMYFLDRMEGESAAYTVPMRLRLRGALDPAALERALGEVVRRHETLRTRFHETDGVPAQRAAPFAGFALPVEDLSAVDAGAREAEVERRGAEDADRPFDLAAGPVFRATLLRVAPQEHVLLLCMHHIVSDAWSLDVLRRELEALYAAYSIGDLSPLPEPPVRYADFAAWQRERLGGGALDGALAWWRTRLAGAPERMDLPADRPRPAARSGRGGRVSAPLPAEVLEGLAAVGRGEGASVFMALLAVFQVLLAKHGAGDDLVVGTPVAGRTRRETEGLVGLFLDTLVLRGDLGGDPTFRALLGRVRGAVLDAYDHAEVPFERLVTALRPERSPGHAPLVQVMFTFLEVGFEARPPSAGVAFEREEGDKRTTKLDLTLTCTRRPTGVTAALEYAADLFDRATAERMLARFLRLAALAAGDPDRRLSALDPMTEAERGEVLLHGAGPARPYPSGALHRDAEAWAARAPEAVALVHEGGRFGYAAVDGSAGRLARALRARGIGPGAYVPVLAERGPHVAVAMLACLKAGAAFVPLDSAWPVERLRGALDALRPPLLLAGGGALARAEPLGVPVLPIALGDGAEPPLEGDFGDGDPLYAIHTSGSTGTPKAAVAAHGGVANRFRWMTETFGADAARSVLATTPPVYDSAVWQLLWPLTLGGRTVVPRAGGEADPESLARLIEDEGVTMADFVPSVFNALVPEWVGDPRARERLASLRVVVVGGEAVAAEAVRRFREHFPGVRVVNLYGPTECSIGSVHHRMEGDEGARVPIGRPIANTSARVLDGHGRLVPPGVPGEVHLGGRCVGLGYLGDPARTAAAFVPDAYGPGGGGRLYRTGDLGRWRADGTLELLARIDGQVKVRGVRVETGEVEALLLRHPGVRDARVVAAGGPEGGLRLVAYVAAAEPEAVEPSALRDHLRAHLPGAMVPAAFVVLPSLPRTAGGKVDLRALPAPRWEARGEHVPPRTPAEEALAAIWAEVLGVERVGAHDDFFALGGHSLLAVRVASRARRALGVEVPLRTLFEHPTVAGLAGCLRVGAGDDDVPLRRLPRVGDPPASFGQERLWRAFRADPADTSFTLQYAFRLRGRVDADALARALAELARRHEPLRTTLREASGTVLQVIHPPGPVALREVEVEGEAGLQALAGEEIGRPFDLERGPVLRAFLARVGEGESAFVLTLPHAVTDGWSTAVWMRELSALYAAYAAGREPELPEPEVLYADFAAWERERLSGGRLERAMAYWAARLAGAPRLALSSVGAGTDDSARAESLPVSLDDALALRLRVFARREGCTPYMALLAVFQALLARMGGAEDVCVGTPVAGRERREVEALVGFFTNTLVIRADLSGTPGFRTLLGRVREAVLGAHAHADLPFALLAEALSPGAGAEEMPLFQAVFELEHARGPGETLRLDGAEVTPLPPPSVRRTLRSELRLTLVDDGARIAGTLRHRVARFGAETAEWIARAYLALLAGGLDDPERPLAEIVVPPRPERADRA